MSENVYIWLTHRQYVGFHIKCIIFFLFVQIFALHIVIMVLLGRAEQEQDGLHRTQFYTHIVFFSYLYLFKNENVCFFLSSLLLSFLFRFFLTRFLQVFLHLLFGLFFVIILNPYVCVCVPFYVFRLFALPSHTHTHEAIENALHGECENVNQLMPYTPYSFFLLFFFFCIFVFLIGLCSLSA